jgi:hypothetical protein
MSEEVVEQVVYGEGEVENEPKVVPLDKHVKVRQRAAAAEAKVKEYEAEKEARELATMTELEKSKAQFEKLKAERQKLQDELKQRDVKDRKLKAKSEAIGKMGDGFSVDHAAKSLDKLIDQMHFDESTIDGDVAELIESIKRPTTKPRTTITGTPTNELAGQNTRRGDGTSTVELMKLFKDDPAEFANRVQGVKDSSIRK